MPDGFQTSTWVSKWWGNFPSITSLVYFLKYSCLEIESVKKRLLRSRNSSGLRKSSSVALNQTLKTADSIIALVSPSK
mgnify:CR=1 FL=1